ncbi:hypothetical protein SMSP2_00488 [Limihaloglobus sulfuriphilus]|uniref:DUF1638 domain-containing protein n=1 Tax=Limihaloglobus sulfuriphilus TaxID=1851148 RepID=A0A1Q2MBR8_9BACT|nr:DUF1638 domain-containing protein [Limihaloglobus sulfuriphilus]AQQ70146.1 hypothetical protein SMSP2_00488 [Limihaloglobus sulfuriphilus]
MLDFHDKLTQGHRIEKSSKRILCVTCRVLQREVYLCASRSPNIVDVVLMPQGLHNDPNVLRDELTKQISRTSDEQGNTYDAVVLGYGLCSNGVVGLEPEIPLVIPRGHDCVTLLLGSKDRYRDHFDSHRGIYWYSRGWIEHCLMPGKERYEFTYNRYLEKYGEENAKFLMEVEETWMNEYSIAAYIEWPELPSEKFKDFTKDCAKYLNWEFQQLQGSSQLLQDLVDGNWNEDDFLAAEPGQMIDQDLTNSGIITAVDA